MLISQIQRRIIFQQIKLFKITNNSYKTNAYFRNVNNNQFLQIQQRHYGIKDFFEAFREKLDENIKQTPEFGGDLKKLSDTSGAAASTAKQAAGKVAESVEAVKKKTQEIIEPIAANPNVQEAGKKAVQASGLLANLISSIFHAFFEFLFAFVGPLKRAYRKTSIKKNLDTVFLYKFSPSRYRFGKASYLLFLTIFYLFISCFFLYFLYFLNCIFYFFVLFSFYH